MEQYRTCFGGEADIYPAENPVGATVIICPGGGYCFLSDREGEPVARAFNRRGYGAVVLKYSLDTPPLGFRPLKELSWTVDQVRQGRFPSVSADRLFLCGFSAGGHLAASYGVYWNHEEAVGTCRRESGLEGIILGYPVISLTGPQAGFITDSNYSKARIRRIEKERIENEISKHNIIIVAGFQGMNRYDNITTLGRGGSDTSAVALAAAFHADLCQIFTDVDGVYTADPRIVPNAQKLDEITYDEMLELASLGANVLHNRSVEMAKKYNVNLEVVSSLERKPGTKVKEVTDVEKMLIKGVARDNDVARISVVGVPDNPGIAFRLFSTLASKKIDVDIILQSIGRHGSKDISFTVSKSNLEEAVKAVESLKNVLHFQSIERSENISKVSVVGAGMQSNPGVAAKMFEALMDANINIQMISTSEIKISVLIDLKDSTRAVAAIHDAFLADLPQ